MLRVGAFLVMVALPAAAVAQSAEKPPTAGELAKQLQNPVAELITLPFQANVDTGLGSTGGSRLIVNVQPVIPLQVTPGWNVVTRVIVPVTSAPPLTSDRERINGIADTTATLWLGPAKLSGLLWGIGPALLLPTATKTALGSGQFGIGPSVVALQQSGQVTLGVLANQLWSVDGEVGRAPVSQTFVQPFAAYTLPSGINFGLNSETTINWDATRGNRWTVPINATVSKVASLGGQPVSFLIGARYYVVSPEGGPDWGLRLALTLLFPQGKK